MSTWLQYALLFLTVTLTVFGIAWATLHYYQRSFWIEIRHLRGKYRPTLSRLKAAAMGMVLVWVLGLGTISMIWLPHPIFGLLGLGLIPLVLSFSFRWIGRAHRRAIDHSGVGFLHALYGLTKAGIPLPIALFRLADQIDMPFAKELGRQLQTFQRGQGLKECLSHFRKRSDLKRVRLCWRIIEMAYEHGLSLCPLLEKMLPIIEAEVSFESATRSMQRGTLAQMSVCWIVLLSLFAGVTVFQPNLVNQFLNSSYLSVCIGFFVMSQGIGVYFIWRITRFL